MKKLNLLWVVFTILFVNLGQAQYILTINYEDMEAYIGKDLSIRVTELPSGDEVARKVLTVEDTNFTVELYVLLEGRDYRVEFFADVNGNGEYDTPPTDHAWRRLINDAGDHTTITFTPDTNYTDIPTFPELFNYSTYASVWGGKWMNQTFGSSDSIMAGITIECDSVFGFFSTKGVFGNPNTVEFNYAAARPGVVDSIPDTLRIALAAPWTGFIEVIQEQLHANLLNNGLGLKFDGTIGYKQILGLYEVSVGDTVIANGYFYVKELEILDSVPALEIDTFQLSDVSCANGIDGSISLTIEGGVPEYTFLWSNGNTTPSANFLTAGNYTVTVTDGAGCILVDSFTVTQPEPLNMDITVTDVSCFGACDASLTFEISGGTLPYSIDEPKDLCAGTYTITLTDAQGCFDIDQITINSPAELLIEIIIIEGATNGQANGSIEIGAGGGVGPFQYSIDNSSFQSSSLFTGLSAGYYTVSVRDANGCITEQEVYVFDLTAVHDLQANFKFYPNPASSFLYFESDLPLSVDLLNASGALLQKEVNVTNEPLNIQDLAPGVYLMKISDGYGTGMRKLVKL